MTQAVAKTGSGPTAVVAIEQHFPKDQRIIDDDLAYRILPRGMRAFVWLMRLDQARDWIVRVSEKSLPGIWAGIEPCGFEAAFYSRCCTQTSENLRSTH